MSRQIKLARPLHRFSLLRALVALSLVYLLFLLLDLALHPLAPGIGLSGSVAFRYIMALVVGLGTVVVGALIVRRVPGNVVGLLLIIFGVGAASWSTRADWGSAERSALAHFTFNIFANGIAFASLIMLFLHFPTGQIYPRWAAPWLLLYAGLRVVGVALELVTQTPQGARVWVEGPPEPINPFLVPALLPYRPLIIATIGAQGLVSLLALLAALGSLILRYRAARRQERQQIKWFVWTTLMIIALLMVLLAGTSALSMDVLDTLVGKAIRLFIYAVSQALPTIAIGIAILRYRLWDIDIIINRTLVYTLLTLTLGLLYVGCILLSRALIAPLTGGSELAIVASTLLIAVLFLPLRRRIQRIIDKRFYRRKYDAAKVLAGFGVTVRDETDLERLTGELLRVVDETMQPEFVGLWLRDPQARSTTEAAPSDSTLPR
jgi:hypothetical protein